MENNIKPKRKVSQKLSDLLDLYFQSASDAGRSIEATQHEGLIINYESWLSREGAENIVCDILNEMCIESLEPASFEKWEEVLGMLIQNRKNLDGHAPSWFLFKKNV